LQIQASIDDDSSEENNCGNLEMREELSAPAYPRTPKLLRLAAHQNGNK
jgi:hypothetical protein